MSLCPNIVSSTTKIIMKIHKQLLLIRDSKNKNDNLIWVLFELFNVLSKYNAVQMLCGGGEVIGGKKVMLRWISNIIYK